MIICNFRPRCRAAGNKAGLANTRIADQADISQQFKFQNQIAGFPRLAKLGKCRCTIRRIRELRIPAATAATFTNDCLLTNFRQISQYFSRRFILDNGPCRYLDITGQCICTILILDIAILTILG